MRLLVVTARYPTPDRPSAGSFVRERLAGVDARVVAPPDYTSAGWLRYARLAWQALTIRGRFDGVECHFVLPTGPLALVAARLRRLPLVVYAHGSDVRSHAHRSSLHRWLARLVLRGAAGVVTNSLATAAEISALAGVTAEVIPPGVDLRRFRPTPRPEPGTVLYLGGDVDAKGVEIARQLADTLAGPGLQDVAPHAIPDLIASHDIMLVPSREEGFGLVAAEAIAAGRWVVAADTGGLREVVTDGVNGTLVADGGFAAALRRVPDYDPGAVAETAARFDIVAHRRAMAETWRRIRAARDGAAR